MNIERTTDYLTGAKSWTITIERSEFNTLDISPSDQRLLNECASPDATIADTLLGLELIARRIEGQALALRPMT